jgi:pimeloyl-ACP methyl ester carboxylesterase
VLAHAGFGVLMVDARGHGDSAGRAMDFGWHGDADIAASVEHLVGRDDVEDDRIAVVGMSMGAEEAIGASAADRRIRAVVAEGATARSAGDEAWLSDAYGWRGALQEHLERAQDVVIRVLSGADAPMANRDAVRRSGTTRYLLIAAGSVADEQKVAYDLASIAPDRVEVWVVPGAGHTAGLRTDRAAWARRVGDFLGQALELDTSTNPEGRAR